MPQQSLLDEVPTMTGLRIDLRLPEPGLSDALQVWVHVQNAHGDYNAVWVAPLPGLEADFLLTLVEEVTSAWAYGEDRRAVSKAAAAVKKQARAHARRHNF